MSACLCSHKIQVGRKTDFDFALLAQRAASARTAGVDHAGGCLVRRRKGSTAAGCVDGQKQRRRTADGGDDIPRGEKGEGEG